MATTTEDLPLRAIIGIRNSGRKGGDEPSPTKQLELATEKAARHRGHVFDVFRENGVSGGTPLDRRKFGEAITRCENDEADMIVWAFPSRNDRDMVVNHQAIQRMDKARKLLVAGDEILTHKTLADWRRNTMRSMFDTDYRLACKENAERYIPGWIDQGWWLGGRIPPGWHKAEGEHTLTFLEKHREAISEAFALRLAGTTIDAVRIHLADHKLPLSYRSVQIMLKQPLYKGLLKFGEWENPTFYAADPVVTPRVFDDVQKMRVPTGRRAKSDRLLARLGIVRCAGCTARMVVGAQTKPDGRRYPFYTCGADKTCLAPATISADLLEGHVIARAKLVIADVQERESAGREYRAIVKRRDALARQLAVNGADLVRIPAGPARDGALQEIGKLQREHDAVDAEAQRLSTLGAVEVVDASALDDTDPATLGDRRRIIRRAVPDVVVHRGRGSVDERVTFETLA